MSGNIDPRLQPGGPIDEFTVEEFDAYLDRITAVALTALTNHDREGFMLAMAHHVLAIGATLRIADDVLGLIDQDDDDDSRQVLGNIDQIITRMVDGFGIEQWERAVAAATFVVFQLEQR